MSANYGHGYVTLTQASRHVIFKNGGILLKLFELVHLFIICFFYAFYFKKSNAFFIFEFYWQKLLHRMSGNLLYLYTLERKFHIT